MAEFTAESLFQKSTVKSDTIKREISVASEIEMLEKRLEQFPKREGAEKEEDIQAEQKPLEPEADKPKLPLEEELAQTRERLMDIKSSLSMRRTARREPTGSALEGGMTEELDDLLEVVNE